MRPGREATRRPGTGSRGVVPGPGPGREGASGSAGPAPGRSDLPGSRLLDDERLRALDRVSVFTGALGLQPRPDGKETTTVVDTLSPRKRPLVIFPVSDAVSDDLPGTDLESAVNVEVAFVFHVIVTVVFVPLVAAAEK